MGRPKGDGLKLTPALQEEICASLRLSVPEKYAAEAAGIAESTFQLWMLKGRNGEAPYVGFVGAVTRARAEAVKNLTVRALAGAKGSQQATWFLERRYRKEYGANQPAEADTTKPRRVAFTRVEKAAS